MQKTLIHRIFTTGIVTCCLMLGGCGQTPSPSDAATVPSSTLSETATPAPADIVQDSQDATAASVQITIPGQKKCGGSFGSADIGFSLNTQFTVGIVECPLEFIYRSGPVCLHGDGFAI